MVTGGFQVILPVGKNGIFLNTTKSKSMTKTTALIPLPNNIKWSDGYFNLSESTGIIFDIDNEHSHNIFELFQKNIADYCGFELKKSIYSNTENQIRLIINNNKSANNESYQLTVDDSSIDIIASTTTGIFYGCQTLQQLLETANQEKGTYRIPNCNITDEPRFKWRGMHLDVSRHFFSVDFIKKQIDRMARLKMNVFHWHLTDDQGWRIEIKSFPKLIKVSSNRKETDGSIYGGYYTQENIREVVAYAEKRQVTIVPEIEMPGHTLALLAAYPELSCSGGSFDVPNNWGIFDDIFCAGNEKTFEFLEIILMEIIDLFPGQYIHIGGDEAPKTRWETCQLCRNRIQDENLKNEDELHSYFIKRIQKFLLKQNRRLIGWDEILEGGLANDSIVMSWRGMDGGIKAALAEHDVIMSPTSHCYFDYYQAKENEPKAIGGFTPLEKVYEFDPIPKELSQKSSNFILGGQANVWTEYMHDENDVEYMIYPRLFAMAEVLWTEKTNLSFSDFKTRLNNIIPHLDHHKINYCPIND